MSNSSNSKPAVSGEAVAYIRDNPEMIYNEGKELSLRKLHGVEGWEPLYFAVPVAAPMQGNAYVMLQELLARIHRDGGHHSAAVGTEQSVKDADAIVARIYAASVQPNSGRDAALEEAALVCDAHESLYRGAGVVSSAIRALAAHPANNKGT